MERVEKQLTAVEWLDYQLFIKHGNITKEDIANAKAMEKEQKAKEYMRGYNDAKNFNKLITENFKSE